MEPRCIKCGDFMVETPSGHVCFRGCGKVLVKVGAPRRFSPTRNPANANARGKARLKGQMELFPKYDNTGSHDD